MVRPYWWFNNQHANTAECSRRIVLGFFSTFIWVEKGVFNFQTSQMLEV